MKHMYKKCLAILLSISMVPLFKIPVEAKIIEPEVVKTETWTTSYFIDDDMETLYPYIQCEADIYNDGTIKLYMWNTHEWDGFAVYEQRAVIPYSIPYEWDTPYGCLDGTSHGWTDSDENWEDPNHQFNITKLQYLIPNMPKRVYMSTYSSDYECEQISSWQFYHQPYIKGIFDKQLPEPYYSNTLYADCLVYSDSLAKLNFSTTRPESYNYIYNCFIFTPKHYLTGNHIFTLFGHSFAITPELLSGNVIATPEPSEQEKRIAELEEQNRLLLEQNNKLINEKQEFENKILDLESKLSSIPKPGDLNCDGIIDVLDQIILLRFLAGTIDELPYITYRIKEENEYVNYVRMGKKRS